MFRSQQTGGSRLLPSELRDLPGGLHDIKEINAGEFY